MAESTELKSHRHIPEIDGLRAIAVLLVVGYHAYPGLVPGGYVGVDIFFAISGFVIARTYLFPLIERKHSLREFYIARFRRLAPALFLVLAVTTVAAILILEPHHLISYSYSLLAQPLYLQNFVFWNAGDYFERALTWPLLHTWSLAVEEQFYIVWALAIVYFRRFPRAIWAVLLVAALTSLFVGFTLDVRSPKTVFFMLPTRVWEFTVGILTFLISRHFGTNSRSILKIVPLLMLVSILLSAFLFDKNSSFPGAQAFIATFATAIALLVFDNRKVSNPSIFTYGPLRYVGEISYGFYLWHWPPLAFFFLMFKRSAEPWEATSLMLIAFFGACLSFHFVEQPFRRNKQLWSASRIFTMVVIGSISITLVSSILVATRGLLSRYPTEIQALFEAPLQKDGIRCGRVFALFNPTSEMCPLTEGQSTNSILIIGDSHADVLKALFTDVGEELDKTIFLTTRNCDLGTFGRTEFCSREVLDRVIVQAKDFGVKQVIAISYWEISDLSAAELRYDVSSFLNEGMGVSLMETVPTDPTYEPVQRAVVAVSTGVIPTEGLNVESYRRNIAPVRSIFEEAFTGLVVNILRSEELFCGDTKCDYWENGRPMYFDSNHLTFVGAARLRPLLINVLFEN